MEQLLSHSLLENKLALRQLFGQSVDFYTKDIQICGLACCICMFEGLSSIERLWVMLLDTASREPLDVTGPEQLYEYLLKGSALLHIGKQIYKLKQGDSFYFTAHKRHYVENVSDETSELLWVSSPPTF